jgi:Gpi18-like mannosyltransferase
MKFSSPKTHHLLILILGATLLRVALVPLTAHLPNDATDEGYWKDWMLAIHEHGVLNVFRTTNTDYVGYHWVLAVLTLIQDYVIHGPYSPSTASLHVLVKLPPIAFDAALILVVYVATARLVSECCAASDETIGQLPLVAAVVVAIHPAVVYDSAVWAQTDAAIAAAIAGALLLVATGRPASGWAVWALGFMLKPHPVIIVPILILFTASLGWRACARSAAAIAGVFAVVLGPWLFHGDALRIVDVYRRLFGADYERLSASAWNVWWFWDLYAPSRPNDPVLSVAPFVSFRLAGLMLSGAAALLAVGLVAGRRDLRTALLAGAYLSMAFYIVPVSTHDRYMYPFVAVMLPVTLIERRWLFLYVAASLTFSLNLLASAPPVASQSGVWIESRWSAAFAGANVLLFALFTTMLLREIASRVRSWLDVAHPLTPRLVTFLQHPARAVSRRSRAIDT